AAQQAVSATELDVAVAKRGVNEAQLLGAKAAVVKAQQNLDWTKVTAPISGRVDRTYLTRGNVATGGATQGTVLTTIVRVDPVYAYLDADEQSVLSYERLVAEKKAKSVANGAELPLEIQLAGEPGYPHKGVLDFVSNQLVAGTGALQLRGTVPNPTGDLLPGMYCKGKVPVGEPAEGILIPDAAVQTDQGSKMVFVVGPDNKVVAKPVVLGQLSDGLRVVESGLGKDDKVIVRGMQRVQAGVTVDPQPESAITTPASDGK
ncbi:MAG: efflux RND transporter periplasmic adaptor subunit, partial [Fimbriiglobus sp.]